MFFFLLMIRLPPKSTRTYPLVPTPTLFRSRVRRQRNIRDRRIENLHEGSKGKRKVRQGKDPSPQRRRAGLTHSVEPRLAAMICAIRASTAGSSPTLACLEKAAFAGLPIKVSDMSLDRKSTRLNSSH